MYNYYRGKTNIIKSWNIEMHYLPKMATSTSASQFLGIPGGFSVPGAGMIPSTSGSIFGGGTGTPFGGTTGIQLGGSGLPFAGTGLGLGTGTGNLGLMFPWTTNTQSQQIDYPCPPGCNILYQCSGCTGGFVVVNTAVRPANVTTPAPITMPPPANTTAAPTTTTTTTTSPPPTTTTTRRPTTNTTTTSTTTVYYIYPSWCSSWCQLYYKPTIQPRCVLYSWLGI
ncbi:uncharacterized protein LOC142323686 [Lycorma delicatula]|uniref:uncharacterized protein LOC142323686 n=1 Tax=Lycorma delicatula TaxID=130591 RepID=UPI003F51946C